MRKFNFRESQTLDFQFWDKYGAVSYTEILYMIQSNRVENASNASMPLYTTFLSTAAPYLTIWALYTGTLLRTGKYANTANKHIKRRR